MKRGLVVGKFSPLHRGHVFIVGTALAACDEVLVLSWSQPEFPRCEAATRERWLRTAFPAARVLVLDPATHALPPNDADDETQRSFVARMLDGIAWRPDWVFTSERYGDGFAAHLARHWGHAVEHVCVDLARERFPVSGTALRGPAAARADWLSPQVLADLTPRVCVLGAESSGKSTLAAALADALDATCVAEFGREFWEQSPPEGDVFSPAQLLTIAQEQVRREEAACRAARGLLVCDTSPLTTWVYAMLDHGAAPDELTALAQRRYDLAIYCASDFPFQQDGTRRGADFSRRQAEATLEALRTAGQPFVVAQGSLAQRVRDLTPRLAALR